MIIQVTNFNIKQIADSGQCFRMTKTSNGSYKVIAYGKYLELKQIDDETIEVSCTKEEWERLWSTYFDMRYDYSSVVKQIENGEDTFLKKAVNHGRGIRILRQEPFEALISFIVSQRKSIPAIRKCIELLCEKYGEKKSIGDTIYHTFPTPESLANASLDELRETGLGYRDIYIKESAKAIATGKIDLEKLKELDYNRSINILMDLKGVGIKVASCVALFGLHYIDAFPIDVWIQRAIDNYYSGYFNIDKYKGYAGIIQQYIFYYMISK